MSDVLGPVRLPPLDHIGVVVKDIDKTVEFLSSTWGLGPWEILEYAPSDDELEIGEPYRIKLAFASLGSARLELIQPLDGKSLWSEFLENKGEGIQHIAFMVSKWDEMVPRLKDESRNVVAGGIISGEKRWRYYKTDTGGITFQLEEPGGVFKSLSD
ncbi:MAG: VOC family protein [Desulfobacteraceae bacterium]|nr:VOC family protein [Desulfobacteraceae bacterium]